MPLYRKRSITLSPEKKPDNEKPDRSKLEPEAGRLRPGLERRLRAAKTEKSSAASKSVSCKDLVATAEGAKNKFTLAAIELFEFTHIEGSKNTEQAEKLAHSIEQEINAQLRHDDLVAYSGKGRYYVYLPETAKTEAKMVLERLTRQICKRNQKRPIAPQVSLSYSLIQIDSLSAQSSQNESLAHWLARYRLVSPETFAQARDLMEAQDLWKDAETVWIKRFVLKNAISTEKKKEVAEILSSIQINGLSLFPRLLDFYIGDTLVCLTVRPVSERLKNLHSAAKTAHTVLIAVCDLFIQLDALTPSIVPPKISGENFLAGGSDSEIVYKTLDSHIVCALLDTSNSGSKIDRSDAATSMTDFVDEIAKTYSDDECFATAMAVLKELSSLKNKTNSLQKIRATLKRHEERLRRAEPATGGGKS